MVTTNNNINKNNVNKQITVKYKKIIIMLIINIIVKIMVKPNIGKNTIIIKIMVIKQ